MGSACRITADEGAYKIRAFAGGNRLESNYVFHFYRRGMSGDGFLMMHCHVEPVSLNSVSLFCFDLKKLIYIFLFMYYFWIM